MMISDEEKALLFQSASNKYIFDKIFKDHNDGKEFDLESWFNKIDELTSDPMFNLDKEKQKEFSDLLTNLDDFTKDGEEEAKPATPKLVLS